MSRSALLDTILGARQWAPWTAAGEPDPDLNEADRQIHHALLTNPDLLTFYRQRFPRNAGADCHEMVRALGYVWDCPHDGTANVSGYCCARCGRTRARMRRVAARERVSLHRSVVDHNLGARGPFLDVLASSLRVRARGERLAETRDCRAVR